MLLDDGVFFVEKSGLSEREYFGWYLCKSYISCMNVWGVLGRDSVEGKRESVGGGFICCCNGKGEVWWMRKNEKMMINE